MYFKEHFPLTASICISFEVDIYSMILYFVVYIFSLLSCHKISTLAFRSMFVVFTPNNIIMIWWKLDIGWCLPNLCPSFNPSFWEKPDIIFLYLWPNNWPIGFFSALKDLGDTRIFPESQIFFVLICKMMPKILRFVYIVCFLPHLTILKKRNSPIWT